MYKRFVVVIYMKNQSTETDSLSHVTTNRGGAILTKVFNFSLTAISNK